MCLLYLLLIFCSFSDWTPLHYAALKGRVEVVQLLLSCNAAIDTKDNGYRPYRCAVDQNRFLIFCCILPLIFAPIFCSFGASSRKIFDRTPLHYAASIGRVEVAQLLLSCNAAVDARTSGYRPYRCIADENTFLIFCCIVPLIFAPDTLFL